MRRYRRSLRHLSEVRAMRPLHLAVDARVAAEDTRGIGRYARAILRRLIARDDIELTLLAEGPFPRRRRAAYERALGGARFNVDSRVHERHDCVWHPANGTFFASSRPSVVTIHDAVPFRYPDSDSKRREHAQLPFLRSAQTAAAIITVSQFARGELRELLRVASQRIRVIPHGVEPSFSPGLSQTLASDLKKRAFFFFVGDPIRERRKNFDLLYAAFRRAWRDGDGPALAVAGPRAPELPGVLRVGELGDDLVAGAQERLRDCYRAAIALVIPSYHETFGMPLLEAMACGTPVIASAAGALPEVGGDAALYAPSDDAGAWADAMLQISQDLPLRERLSAAGLQRAGHFSWDESAREHLGVFHSVLP